MSYKSEKWDVIDLEYDWKINDIIEKFRKIF